MATSVIAFDHIAIGAKAIADAPAFLVGELGGRAGFGGPSPGYSFFHWDFAETGRIEVLEPIGKPGGFLHRFLDRNGPGIHHTTFKVPDLRAICDRAEAAGYTIVGYDDSNPGWKEAFLHPKQAMGVVVQFAEQGDSDGDYEGDATPAGGGSIENPPEPASVVGIRMVSADRERAKRQWATVLEGQVQESEHELVFTWPGSSMRVAVTIDADSADRSDSIELSAQRKLELPEGPHPLLGARFVELG